MEKISKKKMYRVAIPIKGTSARASVIVDPNKKYGEYTGLELIQKYPSEVIE